MSTPTTRAVINVDLGGPVINRHLYGHFAEHLGRCIYGGFWVGEDSELPNVGGIRTDVVEALRALNIPNLRWPGGCFADEYHWQDGIGPRQDRPIMVNTHWGNVEENNHFGTHEFMALCELLGADPYVNGNVGSGTVREMSEWVEYLTRDGDSPMVRQRKANGREKAWRVPFWGIGNEAWGCGGNMRPEAYADEARRFATFLRDHGDNKLYRIAAGANDDNLAWTEALMKAVSCLGCGNKPRGFFQGISFHYYTHDGDGIHRSHATDFDDTQYYRTMIKAADIDRVIKAHRAVMDSYDPAGVVGLVCDEWGTWWQVDEGTNPGFLQQQNTLRDALVAGLHFDIFHSHAERLIMANIAQTVNVLQSMILTDDQGGLVLTPTYHVFEMNKGHQDAASLAVHQPGGPATIDVDGTALAQVTASASRKGDTVLISAGNLSLDSGTMIDFDLRGGSVSAARGRILTADRPQAHNTVAEPTAVAPVELEVRVTDGHLIADLPPHSFATIEVDLAS
ncbi:alpha-N-arabinofuranosidase [Microlunatus parietis]|uniref:non-reducing end alpha-L-arabinofuranosidase n=1 Tax=Microlunatus parietis TaxID=682979 RepID=A0A7Y9LDY9_9ACTN|nr:alpha-L-arabinofuranosidase C-terminal domain-containing protein [Microlunatus parietis]NYE74417.1 alpha-N-arabinofuranosidase [Microlunatus parietis]